MGKRGLATLTELSTDVARLVDELEKETDRGVALVGATFLDDVLDVMLRALFAGDGEAANKLLSPGRPLESFGSRAHLAYCVGLLGRDTYHDINLIREVRNDFAHRKPVDFAHAEIRDKCRRLKVAELMMPGGSGECRDRFLASVVMIANHLIIQTASLKRIPEGQDYARNGVLRLR
jgi:DNA-binding MltR family transcriptional regulator